MEHRLAGVLSVGKVRRRIDDDTTASCPYFPVELPRISSCNAISTEFYRAV